MVVSKNSSILREKSATSDDIWLVNAHVVSGARGQLADKPVMGVPVHEDKSFLTLPMPPCLGSSAQATGRTLQQLKNPHFLSVCFPP